MSVSYKFMYKYRGAWIYKVTVAPGQVVYAARDFEGWITEGRTEELVKEKVELIQNDRGNRAFKSGTI